MTRCSATVLLWFLPATFLVASSAKDPSAPGFSTRDFFESEHVLEGKFAVERGVEEPLPAAEVEATREKATREEAVREEKVIETSSTRSGADSKQCLSSEPIAAIRADANQDSIPDRVGDTVEVAGQVTAELGSIPLPGRQVGALQDSTGGIHIALSGQTVSDQRAADRGDRLHVRGVLRHVNGLARIEVLGQKVIETDRRRLRPMPLTIPATASEQYEGSLARVEGTVTARSENQGGEYFVLQEEEGGADSKVTVFVADRHVGRIQPGRFETGDRVAVTGIVGQFDLSYQVHVREKEDLSHVSAPGAYLWWALVGLSGFGVVTGGAVLFLRAAVRRRTRELKRRKEELKRKERHLRSITENVSDGIYRSTDGGLVYANQALIEMFGYDDLEELKDVDTSKLYANPSRRRELIEKEHREGGLDGEEVRYRRKDGSTFVGLLSTDQIEDGPGGKTYFDGAITDITERKRQEEKLRRAREEAEQARREAEEASQAKSAFLANMSHEIRTPLTSILGFAEAIGEEAQNASEEVGSEPLGRFASLIERSGRRLMETLDGVLNLSKLEAGEMELKSRPIDLSSQAQAVAQELRPRAEKKGLDLKVETGEDPARAQADDGGVQIVLQNLLSNAIKYTEEGTVEVRAFQENGHAAIEVEDTGIGMEPEVASRLFEPFRQASEGLSREYEGTGVGLAVTKKAIEEMNGSIRVETQKGEGSQFIVRLPRVEEDSGPGK